MILSAFFEISLPKIIDKRYTCADAATMAGYSILTNVQFSISNDRTFKSMAYTWPWRLGGIHVTVTSAGYLRCVVVSNQRSVSIFACSLSIKRACTRLLVKYNTHFTDASSRVSSTSSRESGRGLSAGIRTFPRTLKSPFRSSIQHVQVHCDCCFRPNYAQCRDISPIKSVQFADSAVRAKHRPIQTLSDAETQTRKTHTQSSISHSCASYAYMSNSVNNSDINEAPQHCLVRHPCSLISYHAVIGVTTGVRGAQLHPQSPAVWVTSFIHAESMFLPRNAWWT